MRMRDIRVSCRKGIVRETNRGSPSNKTLYTISSRTAIYPFKGDTQAFPDIRYSLLSAISYPTLSVALL